jgi:hypothetical protein
MVGSRRLLPTACLPRRRRVGPATTVSVGSTALRRVRRPGGLDGSGAGSAETAASGFASAFGRAFVPALDRAEPARLVRRRAGWGTGSPPSAPAAPVSAGSATSDPSGPTAPSVAPEGVVLRRRRRRRRFADGLSPDLAPSDSSIPSGSPVESASSAGGTCGWVSPAAAAVPDRRRPRPPRCRRRRTAVVPASPSIDGAPSIGSRVVAPSAPSPVVSEEVASSARPVIPACPRPRFLRRRRRGRGAAPTSSSDPDVTAGAGSDSGCSVISSDSFPLARVRWNAGGLK